MSRRNDRLGINVDTVETIDAAIKRATACVVINCRGRNSDPEWLGRLRDILVRHHGPCEVNVTLNPIEQPNTTVRIKVNRKWWVTPTRKLLDELEQFAGAGNVRPMAGEYVTPKSTRPRYGAAANGRPYASN
ncbi:MAG: hypothetical protein WCP86_00465 [bacterium]